MKFSITTLITLAVAAIASPTPGGFDDYDDDYYGRLDHVYCTGESNAIVDVDVNVDLGNRIRQCNRDRNWNDGYWGYGYGRDTRYYSDEFCRGNDRVHGVWGCTQPCYGEIDDRYCTRCDSGRW